MITFNEWLLTEMGHIPVHMLGQQAENLYNHILDALKPEIPGTELEIIYKVPTDITMRGPQRIESPSEHTYNVFVKINKNGEWEHGGNAKYYDDAEYPQPLTVRNKEYCLSAIEGAVASAYYHGGELWVVKNGKKEKWKDSSPKMTFSDLKNHH